MFLAGSVLGAAAAEPPTAAGDAARNKVVVGWTLDVSQLAVPDAPAAGKIHGEEFKPDKVRFENNVLDLRQGKDFFADREFKIFLFLKKGESVAGKKFRVDSKQEFDNPHVIVGWMPKEKVGAIPNTTTYMDRYAMILEFGSAKDGVVRGKISLCVPDDTRSFVAGTFSIGETAPTQPGPVQSAKVVGQSAKTIDRGSPAGLELPIAGPDQSNLPFSESSNRETHLGSLPGIIALVAYLFLTVGYWRVYTKAGLPGWGCLIPFYNLMLWMRCGGKPGWWAIWLFVPPINLVIYVIVAYEIARNFGKGVAFATGLVYACPVFAAILGFGPARYNPTLLRLRK